LFTSLFGNKNISQQSVPVDQQIEQDNLDKVTGTISQTTPHYPYCIFINSRSGGKAGKYLLHRMYQDGIGRHRVCDLYAERPPNKLLKLSKVRPLSPVTAAVTPVAICCGGDGTMRWIMDESHKLAISQKLSYAIVPLGTGNDLFNHLVNSHRETSSSTAVSAKDISADSIAENYLDLYAPPRIECDFDRWQMSIQRMANTKQNQMNQKNGEQNESMTVSAPNDIDMEENETDSCSQFSSSSSSSTGKYMNFNNYVGIGIDGDITSTFHTLRRYRPNLFFHRIVNKMWYAIVWIYRFITAKSKSLSANIELYCDDQPIDIKDKNLHGIILTNVNSYAGGSKLWTFNTEPWQPLKSDDGIIEVSLEISLCFASS
jgi:hypothetical protein